MMLPTELQQRSRVLAGDATHPPSGIVVWPRMALRGHDNPLLNVGIALAAHHGVSVFVYQGLAEGTPWASDRVHTFVLQGAARFHRELHSRGLHSVLHVERAGQRAPVLGQLQQQGWWIVADDVPVPPLRGWLNKLAQSGVVVAVDAACTVPMQRSSSAPTRAHAFRSEHIAAFRERVGQRFPSTTAAMSAVPPLPVTGIDPDTMDDGAIAELLATARIDHGTGPVPNRGGADAGEQRLEEFISSGALGRYARDRNDPLRPGTSRLSPWLHFGFLSPWAVAARALQVGGDGADKFIDELFVWRELPWHWAHHHSDKQMHTLAALPAFAQQALAVHQPRSDGLHVDDDSLCRGQTGDPLWDTAQQSLLLLGELHNNVRMTWGKALVGWSSATDAQRRLIDLNHRYAVDGRDPASYGGLLWCLGLFDRPFPTADGGQGLRERSPVEHARRLNVSSWSRQLRSQARRPMRIHVIGAGPTGLMCARTLQTAGHDVTVFDRGRTPGGRASARAVEGSHPKTWVEYGASWFTCDDRRLRTWMLSLQQRGLIRPASTRAFHDDGHSLRPAFASPAWRGVLSLQQVMMMMAEGIDVRSAATVESLDSHDVDVDWRLLCMPTEQAQRLTSWARGPSHRPSIVAMMHGYQPMALRHQSHDVDWLSFDNDPALDVVRSDGNTVVAQANGAWSESRLGDVDGAAAELAALVTDRFQLPAATVVGHRWSLARATGQSDDDQEGAWLASEQRLGGATADGIADAWLAGMALAGMVMRQPR